jgi:transcriptional antiterminator NusG
MARQEAAQKYGRNWYVIHTYSGYEDAVARALKQRIEALGMEDKIFQVFVPKEKRIQVRGGKRRIVEERIYPGYVLVEMIVTDDSWYVVRNTPRVTGFVGAGTTPTPISREEVAALIARTGVEEPEFKVDVRPGETVQIVDGPFKDFDGKVSDVDEARGKVKVLVNVFGRDTPVELDFLQIKKL